MSFYEKNPTNCATKVRARDEYCHLHKRDAYTAQMVLKSG